MRGGGKGNEQNKNCAMIIKWNDELTRLNRFA